jgi:hypothetical protein
MDTPHVERGERIPTSGLSFQHPKRRLAAVVACLRRFAKCAESPPCLSMALALRNRHVSRNVVNPLVARSAPRGVWRNPPSKINAGTGKRGKTRDLRPATLRKLAQVHGVQPITCSSSDDDASLKKKTFFRQL